MSSKPPTHRQIIFNWMMGDPDFASKSDGWWGAYQEVAYIDELIKALGLPVPEPIVEPSAERRNGEQT